MKKILIFNKFTVLLSLFLLISCSESDNYRLLDGGKVQIPQQNGWVLVNYWAPWCEPCLKEIPELNRLSQDLPSPLVAVVGIYFDPVSKSDLQKAKEKYQVKFQLLSPSIESLPVAQPQSLPANYLINSKGTVYGPLFGPQTQKSILLAIKKFQN